MVSPFESSWKLVRPIDFDSLCRLHYIPLSSHYSEIYNIHAYFSGASPSMLEAVNKANQTTNQEVKVVTDAWHDGDAQLRKIARAGRKWKMTIGRKVDMESEY